MRRWLAWKPGAIISSRALLQTNRVPIALIQRDYSATADHSDEAQPTPPPVPLVESNVHGHSVEARSLLRSLLRECSYLSDSLARQWMRQHICTSFRKYERKAERSDNNQAFEERLRQKFKDGRQALSQLQRAATGDRWVLRKVLMMAYGRIGKRRRELLQPLLRLSREEGTENANGMQKGEISAYAAQSETPVESEESLEGLAGNPVDVTSITKDPDQPNNRYQPKSLPHQLYSLLHSQMQYAPPTLTRSNPRRLHPVIPELNTWLRPMPQKRVKNMHKKHYAQLLSRALPPLPQNEWERLRDLASGSIQPEQPKRRRGRSTSINESESSDPGMGALDVVVRYGKVPRRVTEDQHEDSTNKRAVRRLYAKVFSQCPLMEFDVGSQKWRVTWGEQAMLERTRNQRAEAEPSEHLVLQASR